ncbi:MAG: hypothetical protein AAB489_04360, partial [Patescibacteria group bacterium]
MPAPHLSFTYRHWQVKSLEPTDLRSFARARALEHKGTQERAMPFPDPSVYPDISRAVQRFLRAVKEGERIGIFGDYDCDGVTATAILYR